MSKLDLEHKIPKSSIFKDFGLLFLASFWPHFAAIAPSWHPFGDVREVFRLAFSAFARLELQGEPFQRHFHDFVSFLVPLWRIFGALFLKTYIILGGRLAPSVHPFSFPSCPLERASAAKRSESVAWSRPRRRRGPKTT